MRGDALALRLRNANPVAAGDRPSADEVLLERLLAEPRGSAKGPRLRRAALLFAAAAVLLGGTAAGVQRFVVDYFGADDSEPTPAVIIAELRSLDLAAGAHFGTIDAESFVRLAAFDGPEGRVTMYVAATENGDGYCMASATGALVDGGSCGPTSVPEMQIPYGNTWNSTYGDVHILYGRLPQGVAGIDAGFEDGGARPAAVRGPWWIYVVGGEETKAGRRPTELIARRPDGSPAPTQELDPYSFWKEDEFEAAVPASDGSRGQNAVRAAVIDLRWVGGRVGPQLRLDDTYLARTVHASRGSFEVYAAPWGDGGLCFGYFDNGLRFEHTTSGCPSGDYLPEQRSAFAAGQIQTYAGRAGFAVVDGSPPRGSARITALFEDGSSADADLATRSYFAFWFDAGRLVPGRRPTQLVAWDAQGRVIDRFELEPALLAP